MMGFSRVKTPRVKSTRLIHRRCKHGEIWYNSTIWPGRFGDHPGRRPEVKTKKHLIRGCGRVYIVPVHNPWGFQMTDLRVIARKALKPAAALASALFVLAAAGGQRVDASPAGHKSSRPAASAPMDRRPTVAEIDTQENRQLALDLASTFNKSLAKIYIVQGPDAAFATAKEPWKDQNLMTMASKVPDRQLFVAVVTIAELPDRSQQFVQLQVDGNKNTWGGETPEEARHETSEAIMQDVAHTTQLITFGGERLKNDGIVETNPDSVWAKEAVPYIAGFSRDKRPNETNMAVLRRYFDNNKLGPNSTKVATAIIDLQKTGARVAATPSPDTTPDTTVQTVSFQP